MKTRPPPKARIVEVKLDDARELIELWGPSFAPDTLAPDRDVEQAIVWIHPDPEHGPEQVRARVAACERAGAARVKVLAAARESEPLPRAAGRHDFERVNLHEICTELVDELPEPIRDAVSIEVEQALSAAGV